jgi:tetratricopeptide (TPR) repeat protein
MAANPDYAFPWKLQAQIYMNREGLEKDALDRALAAYKSFSDRNSSDPSGYLERYRVFVKKSDFGAAAQELERIWALYPRYPNLNYYRGKLFDVQGNHKAAAENFKKELDNNPNSWNTMVELGKQLIELGQVNEALTLFNKAMQLAPSQPEPKLESGYANFLLKNYQGAVALYQAALVYDKGNPLIYKRMGQAYKTMGDSVGARNAFKKYLEMEPDAPDRAEFESYL